MADIGIIKFQLAGIHFGMYADRILEIVRFTEVRKIPQPLPYVVGITELRNYIVIVVDFRKRLGLSPLLLERGTTMIVTNISSGMIGVLVESISHFRKIPEAKILPPISVAGFPDQLLRGVVAEENEIMIIPDIDNIFTSYIKVQLVPITPSEKIAFQFRFTPGSLSRTLENMLFKEGFLDQKTIKKLPHSMCLPGVLVHKLTTYYPDFFPEKDDTSQETRRLPSSQKIRAGDESYFSLSQKLHLQSGPKKEEPRSLKKEHAESPILASQVSMPSIWEDLHHVVENLVLTHLSGQSVPPETLISHPEAVDKNVTKILDISPVRLSKYLNYHESSETLQRLTQQEAYSRLSRQSFGKAIPLKERLKQLVQIHYRIEEVLQTLSNEQYVLTRSYMRWIAKHYRIPLVKIAKLYANFPELRYEAETNQEKTTTKEQKNEGSQDKHSKGETTPFEMSKKISLFQAETVSEYLHHLAEENKLFDDHVVRAVASRLRIPTCRLSKLRSFYRFRE